MSVLILSIVIFFVSAGSALSTGTTLMMPTPIGFSGAIGAYDSNACLWNRYETSGFFSGKSSFLVIWNSNIPGANGTIR